jgi:hypothetical protein
MSAGFLTLQNWSSLLNHVLSLVAGFSYSFLSLKLKSINVFFPFSKRCM